jgi:ADP-heptose:LPS heptosyltransferase
MHITKEDEEYCQALLKSEKVGETFVVINAGAKSHLKRWNREGFAEVADRLIAECGVSVVLIGREEDKETVTAVMSKMKRKAHNFVGRTNIRQLAALMKAAKLLITNDSAPLHLACAAGTKVLAIFGPTDADKYGPTGEFDVVMCAKLSCSPCESATCRCSYECMKLISSSEVFEAAKLMVEGYEEE